MRGKLARVKASDTSLPLESALDGEQTRDQTRDHTADHTADHTVDYESPREHAPAPCNAAEVDATLQLLSVVGIGPGRIRALRAAFGCAARALEETAERFALALRVSTAHAATMLADARRANAADERAHADRLGARIVALGDPDYPQLLSASPDPPAVLFVRGELAAEPELSIALVGSRRATAYGRLQAGRLAVELAERGVTIVSGGARGIDAEAHRGALRAGGRTIAVLASGLSHIYPPEHAPLFDAIVDAGGAVVTEQCSFIAPRAELFPRRNRIVAALSLSVVVVEAAKRSGALVTARIAVDDLSRDVGCVPGSIDSALSEGCHGAIRDGWAQLVTSADDVWVMLREAQSLAMGAVERAARVAEVDGRTATQLLATPPPRTANARASPRHSCDAGDARTARDAPNRPKPPPDPITAPECSQDALAVLAAIRSLGRAGLDELEGELGWSVGRIAVVTLELETSRRVERDREGAFRCVTRAGRC